MSKELYLSRLALEIEKFEDAPKWIASLYSDEDK